MFGWIYSDSDECHRKKQVEEMMPETTEGESEVFSWFIVVSLALTVILLFWAL